MSAPTPADVAEAARMLRAFAAAAPGKTATERATARRVEGAAAALGALAGPVQQSSDCGTAAEE